MTSMADFEKLRVSLIQKIATADTPEKISALLAQMNNIPTTDAADGGSGKDSADDMSESKINEVKEVVVPEEVLAAREYLHSTGPHGMYKFQTSLTALGNGSNSSSNNSDDNNNSNNMHPFKAPFQGTLSS